MPITQAMCTSFKVEVLRGVHNFTTGGNVFKLALYASSATLGSATTTYSASGEVGSSGSYVAGGGDLTNVTPTSTGTTAFADFADISFTSATITARGALIYNDTAVGNPAVCVLDFGADKVSVVGTFTVQFPTADATNAIIRIN